MKKKRLIIGIVGVLTLVIGAGVVFYTKNFSNKNKGILYGPVSSTRIDYVVESITQNYALIKKNGLYGIADLYGNVVVKPKFKDARMLTEYGKRSKYFLISYESKAILINFKGDELLSKENMMVTDFQDIITGKEYFEVDQDLYDADFNKIYTNTEEERDLFTIIDNKVYYSEYNSKDEKYSFYAYDLTKKNWLLDIYNSIVNYSDDKTYILGNKSIEVNHQTKTITNCGNGYYDYIANKIVLEKNSKKINIDSKGNIYDESELTITKYKNGLYSDSKDCKEDGAKLYNKDGKVVNSTCYYYEDEDKYVAIIDQGGIRNILKLFDESGKVVLDNQKDDETIIVRMGQYYHPSSFNDNTQQVASKIYDLNMKEYQPCKDNYTIRAFGDILVCSFNDSYIVDIYGKKLTDNYDSIVCDDKGVCLIKDATKNGLYFNGKFIVPLSDKYEIVVGI